MDARGGIDIGSKTTIAIYSRLITGYHDIDSDDFAYKQLPIMIGDNVAKFANCTVLAGVSIPNGCIFSADSCVRRNNYMKNGLYGGNLVRLIRMRKISDIYAPGKLQQYFR